MFMASGESKFLVYLSGLTVLTEHLWQGVGTQQGGTALTGCACSHVHQSVSGLL